MALSNDDKMGEDTVIGCVSAGGKVEALLSWNDGRNNVPMIEKFGNIELLNGSNVDGRKVEGVLVKCYSVIRVIHTGLARLWSI